MPSELAKRKFCSRKCLAEHQSEERRGARTTEWVTLMCQECGNPFEVTPGWARNGRRKFCTNRCRHKAERHQKRRLGKAHTDQARAKMSQAATGRRDKEQSSQWKGGSYLDSDGYRWVMIDLLPAATQALVRQMVRPGKKYVQEHRAVMAATLGRPLTRAELVHHRNGEKADNAPTNLLLNNRAAHSMEHREVEKRLAVMEAENAALRAEVERLSSAST